MKKFFITLSIAMVPFASAFAGEEKSCSRHAKAATPEHCVKKSETAHAAADAAHAEHAGDASCPIKGEHTMQPVKLTGSVVCLHCNLHQQDKCEKVFQAADAAKTIYSICPMGETTSVEAAAEHGAAVLEVEGHLMTSNAGSSMLMIQKFAKHSK